MAGSRHPSGQHTDFLRAVLAELQRVVEQDREFWTVGTRLPVVPHAAQLSLLGILLLKGVESGSDDELFTHREELEARLEKAYRASKAVWFEATTKKKPEARDRVLGDSKKVRPAVMKAVNFAEKNIGLHAEHLSSFTDNVQDTLAGLVGKFSEFMQAKLGTGNTGGGAGGVPGAVHAAIGLGMLAGGMVGRREMVPKEVSAARVLARIGAEKDEAGGPEPKPVKRLRGTLKELVALLPKQRA
jgi:hypothetical protein